MGGKILKAGAVLASLFILFILVAFADPVRFVSRIAASDYRLLLAAFVISSLNICIRILKWKVLLGKVGFLELAPVQLLGITISNFSPGKIGEPAKAILLKLKVGTPVSATLPSIIWERVLDILVLMVLGFAGIAFFATLSGSLYIISILCFVFFLVVVSICMLFLYKKPVRRRIFALLKKFPITNRLSQKFFDSFEKSSIQKSRLLISGVLSLAAWLLEGVILYLAMLSIGVQLSPLALACLFALATLIGVATALPGGIGSTDVVMVIFMGALGVEYSLAVTGVLVARFISLWFVNLLGGVSLVYFMRQKMDFKSVF